MSIRLYADEFRCAIYEEAPGGGEADNPNAPMNRPVLAPLLWLPNIYFHSDLDYYGVAAKNLAIPIDHQAVPAKSTVIGVNGFNTATFVYYGQTLEQDQLLLTHNLGYVPKFYSIFNGRFMSSGNPVQTIAASRARFSSVYATTTQIRVHSVGSSADVDLPALTATYGVLVFRQHAPVAAEKMLNIEPGEVTFGQGKFKSAQPPLRVVGPGDAQYAVAQGRTADSRNGGQRFYVANGGAFDFGPYNGTLPAPTYINVTAGV